MDPKTLRRIADEIHELGKQLVLTGDDEKVEDIGRVIKQLSTKIHDLARDKE